MCDVDLSKKNIFNLTHGDLEQTTIRNYQSENGSEKEGINSFHQNMATRGIDFLGFTWVIDGRVAYESSNDNQKSSRLQALEMEFNASMLQKLIRWTLSQLIIPQNDLKWWYPYRLFLYGSRVKLTTTTQLVNWEITWYNKFHLKIQHRFFCLLLLFLSDWHLLFSQKLLAKEDISLDTSCTKTAMEQIMMHHPFLPIFQKSTFCDNVNFNSPTWRNISLTPRAKELWDL